MGTTSIKLITSDGTELSWGSIPTGYGVLIRSGSTITIRSDFVVGATSGTDNAVARYDGTSGRLLQDSLVTIDDSGNITAANMPRTGTATLDFGVTPTDDGSIVVTGQTWVTAASKVEAWVTRSDDEHEALATFGQLMVGSLVVGAGFTIFCNALCGLFTGSYTVNWQGVA